MKTLTVCLLTYNRLEYAKRTLKSTLKNLSFTGGDIALHIASDGDEPEYIETLVKAARTVVPELEIAVSNSGHKGYGANYNLAMQTVHPQSDLILPLEDDWEMLRPFDVWDLASEAELYWCVRLGYIGWTRALECRFVRWPTGHVFLELDSYSAEPHVFAGHPRIETVGWSRTVGPWLEGLDPGYTEFEVARRSAARTGVYWPADLVKPQGDLFAHIGTERSY